MGIVDFFKSKLFFKQIIILFLMGFLLLWLIFKILDVYTKHGKTYVVGDYTGLKIDEIESNTNNDVFNFVIIDSIFDNNLEKQTVVSQTPLPNSNVKKNRKVYITIVASQPEMVSCPNLQDLTVRQASTVLETYGLSLGKIEFVPDIGSTVISWKQMGKEIKPGDKLVKMSKVDLVVGNGSGGGVTYVPNLIGKTKNEARNLIHIAGLNIGSEFFLNRNDTINVKVVRQSPSDSSEEVISLGSTIDIWYE